MEQRTEEWHAARLGKVTASKFAVIVAPVNIKAMADGKLSAGAMTYLCELVGATLTGRPEPEVRTPPILWGERHEDAARRAYEFEQNWELSELDEPRRVDVQTCGFIDHPTEALIGGSPDGLVGDDGMIEIKCPYAPKNHAVVLVQAFMPLAHMAQVQGLLWITHRKWCDFVSYHPDFPLATQLLTHRIQRDDEYITKLSSAVCAFRDRLQEVLKNYE